MLFEEILRSVRRSHGVVHLASLDWFNEHAFLFSKTCNAFESGFNAIPSAAAWFPSASNGGGKVHLGARFAPARPAPAQREVRPRAAGPLHARRGHGAGPALLGARPAEGRRFSTRQKALYTL